MRKMETLADVNGVVVREWSRPSEEDMDNVPRMLRDMTYLFIDGRWLDKKMIRALAPIISEMMYKCPIDHLWMENDWHDYTILYPPNSKMVPPPPPPYESIGYPGWELYHGVESFNDVLERFKGTRLIKHNYNEPGHTCRWIEVRVRPEKEDQVRVVCEAPKRPMLKGEDDW